MTIYLLGFKDSRHYERTTAWNIAEHGSFVFRKGLKKEDNYSSKDVLIRYGDHTYSSYDKKFGEVINRAQSIFQNINKKESYIRLYEAGLNVPQVFFSKEQVKESNYPVVRRSKKHSRASDIQIISSPEDFIQGSFYTELIPSEEEYRLHIFFGECVRISKKIPSPNEEKIDDHIRSSSRGWTLSDKFHMNIEALNKAIPLCIRALDVLNLDFGACDVVIEKDTNRPFLLEVNTCPRLNYYGIEVFCKEIYDHLGISTENIKTGKIIDWEYKDIVPMKYRKGFKYKPSKEDFGL